MLKQLLSRIRSRRTPQPIEFDGPGVPEPADRTCWQQAAYGPDDREYPAHLIHVRLDHVVAELGQDSPEHRWFEFEQDENDLSRYHLTQLAPWQWADPLIGDPTQCGWGQISPAPADFVRFAEAEVRRVDREGYDS